MKSIGFSDDIENDSGLKSLAIRATEILTDESGSLSVEANASWTMRIDSRGRRVLRLRIDDDSGWAEADFSVDELRNEDKLRGRLIRLWGDLLQVAFRRRLETLEASLPAD